MSHPCLIRIADGAVFPMDPNLAQDPRFRYSDNLPTTHIETIKRVQAQEKQQAKEFAAQKAEREAKDELAREAAKKRLAASLEIQEPDEISAAAQKEIDESRPAFIISKASKVELINFALTQFGAKIDPKLSVDKIRHELAKLAGVEIEAAA